MATNANEMEMLRKAIRLLHSSHPNSATELRMMLDEAIKQRYGPELMISNNMSKRLIEEEANFPGRAATPPPQPEQPPATEHQQQESAADEVINLTGSPAKTISDSPDTIMDSDDGANVGGHGGGTMLAGADDDVNLKEFGDLNCAVCGEMVFTATNRLIECSACGTLYHQECHKPAITDEEASEGQAHNWQCDTCLSKPSTSKAAGVIIDEPIALVSAKTKSSATSSRSSSTSNSSSPYPTIPQDVPTNSSSAATAPVTVVQTTSSSSSSSTSKHHHHHHKSSRSHKEERPSSSSSKSGGSSSGVVNPTFNVVSASERSSSSSHSSKKSSSHSSSSTGKSSSSSKSSSSKHHESSKRKGK